MGILNVTPDSFSDGGRFLDSETAVQHGLDMARDGADILDVGGESTRPGSDEVPEREERERVVQVIERLAKELPDTPISVDTRKASVAAAALEAGATIVNDVTAGANPQMFAAVRDAGAGMVLMHMRGEPKTMQVEPHYDDVVAEVREFLRERVQAAASAGISAERVCADPGIGFGKTLRHNLLLLRNLDALHELDVPILVGPSRKSFIGTLLDVGPEGRLEGTAAAVAYAAGNGADVIRVHDVREMVRVVRVVNAIARVGEEG
jgi:dihydropteroate synthase